MSADRHSNVPASIRARLKNKADDTGLEFNQVLQYYAMERFLFRLSQTQWADRMIVKGAAMLRVWDGAIARPTRDIDFLGRIDNTPEGVAVMIRECLEVQVEDGLDFSPDVEVERITVEDRYPGVRAMIRGSLSGARIRLQIDIGIDDLAVPEPGWVDYPTLLGTDAPRIRAYQPSTAVAEKFETMISKGLLNSRVKDYYDIWMLAGTVRFKGEDLQMGISATFGQRGTPIPRTRPEELGEEYAGQSGTQLQWTAFTRKLALSGVSAPSNLGVVTEAITEFIMPAATAAAGDAPFRSAWTPGEGWSSQDSHSDPAGSD